MMQGNISYQAIVAVNWSDDGDAKPVKFDLIKNAIAFTKYDTCYIYDLWDQDEPIVANGSFSAWG